MGFTRLPQKDAAPVNPSPVSQNQGENPKMRIILVVAIMLSCGVGICAESQPSAPTPQANQTQQKPAEKKQEINPPANTAIKIPAAQIDPKQPDEFKTEKPDKSLNDLLIVWFTGALAVFALCQVIAMILQYRVMRVQASSEVVAVFETR